MISNKQFDYFSVLVIGENPEEQISKFDEMSDASEPYVLYSYKDISKYRKLQIEVYKTYLKSTKDLQSRNLLINKINELKNISDDAYYTQLGEYQQFDPNKNIVTSDNPDGKWLTCEIGGRMYSEKLIGFDNKGITSGKKSEINWFEIHLKPEIVGKYQRTWELCVEKLQPKTTNDHLILNNMKNIVGYFENFLNKEQYAKYNSSFFTNAIIINGKWLDMEDGDYSEWVINYFVKFISKLKGDELITIFECTK